jgi:hypothetical protein
MPKTTRLILTGVPPYDQNYVINDNSKTVMAGCGPVAALMLLAYYDRAFGYHRLIKSVPETKTGMPEELILKLRAEMKTSNFELDKDDVQTYGLTLPPAFRSGLRSYVKQYYDADVHTRASTGLNSLEGVFEKSKELLDEGLPHVLLLDYDDDVMPGIGGLFPDHYVVVVGYSINDGRQNLIVNNGLGANFQVVDMTDKAIKPARIYWLEMKDPADGPKDGHQIGPEEHYTWATVDGEKRLEPTILKEGSATESFSWRPADKSVVLTPNSDVSVSRWYD